MEENTVTEEQKYEKTREFIQDWANKNMNYLKLLDNEDKDFRELGAFKSLFGTFEEAFQEYCRDLDSYNQAAISNFAYKKAASYYSLAARVNYEYAEKSFDNYIKGKDQDEKKTDIIECLHYVSVASDSAKRATGLFENWKIRRQSRRPDEVVEYVHSEVDIAVDFALRASAIAQKLVGELIQ